MSSYIDAPRYLVERYPDAVAFDVVGCCMEPDFFEGEILIVSPSAKVEPGRAAAFDYGARMPNLARVERVEPGYIVLRNNQGRPYYVRPNAIIGVVVGVA